MKHIVGFSGGIDSQAVALWCRQQFPAEDIVLLNSTAGRNESHITETFIKHYSETVFPVIQVHAIYSDMWETPGFAETRGYNSDAEMTFDDMIKIKGRAPSNRAQFCTEILKLRPSRRWIEQNVTDDYERYTGVRRDESKRRSETPFREFDEYFDCYVNHPLVLWTKQRCFDFVRANREEINPLYKLGFGRVGCAPCINSGKDDIALWAKRFPEEIEKIKRYETNTGRTYFAPMVPGMAINNIDQVVEWATTGRGGRQQDFIKITEIRPSCESKFGLCE